MIKSLRKKFIIAAMCAIFIVFAVIIGMINTMNYARLREHADYMTWLIEEGDGKLPLFNRSDFNKEKIPPKPERLSEETPFETRYFYFILDSNGDIILSDTKNIAAVSESEAEKYAKAAYSSHKQKGFMDIYRFRKSKTSEGIKVIFLDCRRELAAARMLLLISLLVFALGLLAVFILVMVFSRMVFAPVQESYVRQKQFITDASHEIKTPLAVISANTEVLEMEAGENQWTVSTHNQIDRLNALTSRLLTLARLDEEKFVKTCVRFSLSQAAKETVSSFSAPAKLAGKGLDIDIKEDIYISGDEKQIRQMFSILLDNAVKYSDADSTIEVSLYKKGSRIVFKTFNYVKGIDKGNNDKIFERFYRRDASRNSETGGFGIGLSAAKSIVNAHKGRIQAVSKDGQSLSIIVTLPAAHSDNKYDKGNIYV